MRHSSPPPSSSGSPFSHLRSPVAEVLFEHEIEPQSRPAETLAVKRFTDWLNSANRAAVHSSCALIDERLVSQLSGPSILEVARRIDARYPEVIQNMPRLKAHLDRLDVACRASGFFTPQALKALISALMEEGDIDDASGVGSEPSSGGAGDSSAASGSAGGDAATGGSS